MRLVRLALELVCHAQGRLQEAPDWSIVFWIATAAQRVGYLKVWWEVALRES
jgi:hypothetical protein